MNKIIRKTFMVCARHGAAKACLVFLFAACSNEQKATPKFFDFEGLITEQVTRLGHNKHVLNKTAIVSGHESDSTFLLSGKGWEAELEVFRQMETLNKPIYRSNYKIMDPVKDLRSNLKIREYTSHSAPITSMKFYYHNEFSQLKKIEAIALEKNILYSNGRNFTLEFEEVDGKPLLTHYGMTGFQKMFMRDTVRFSLQGQIN
jgi:hypothetical protein